MTKKTVRTIATPASLVTSVPTEARTQNNMKALADTSNVLTELFFKAGSSRGQDLTALFTEAFQTEPDLAVRLALWVRDARGGAGERKMGRDFILSLQNDNEGQHLLLQTQLMERMVEVGRWDDLLEFTAPRVRRAAFALIKQALERGDALCAKWMPRKGPVAAELRSAFGWTPKFYRKRLVELTKVVETQMCAREWDAINFNHVPSLAMARYKSAFRKNAADKFVDYTTKLVKGEAGMKVNAGAVFPYDVIKGFLDEYQLAYKSQAEIDLVDAQWKALPNFMDDQNVLPVVDVSGSMTCEAVSGVSCLEVAVGLGLYTSGHNKGPYKDVFVTFSNRPELITVKGTVTKKIQQMVKSKWEMNTDLNKVFELILDLAVKNEVPQEGMPHAILILSDMQFDQCAKYDDSAIEMIRRKYEKAGYKVPAIVFWCLNARYGNAPVSYNEKGVALVSGFSPTIMKSVLTSDFESMTPRAVMLKTLQNDRYNYNSGV